MSKRMAAAAGVFLASTCILVAACAEDAPSPNGEPPGPDREDSGSGPTPDGGAGVGDVDGGGPGGSDICAHSEAGGPSASVSAVFMLDRSGSMGDTSGGEQNMQTRWIPATRALNSFFADARTVGLKGTLRDFPQMDATYPREPVCEPDVYKMPKVGLTALPNKSSFKAAIEQMGKPAGSSTVHSALQGAILQAKEIARARPSERVAVVFVTDGLPEDTNPPRDPCQNATYDQIQAAAKAAHDQRPSISTYVVGVGTTRYRDQIEGIAVAGGTGRAFWVDVRDPTKLTGELLSAMNQGRQTLPCDFGLPVPPAGKKLDIDAVQVTYTNGNGAASALARNDACTGNQGWHYDNAQKPTRVVLCAGSCTTAQKDNGAKIAIDAKCTP
ncbi:VWA domain-containing protein [Pendulispora rubella]|uniref:VWA domain-containing protein n=1 Tax=Pendulispora rubella TaxID=2741070 RepID=A0ABZ2KSU1_9BACT